MPEGEKPLEQRPKGGRGRSSSPRVIVLRNIFDNSTTLYVPTEAPRPLAATEAPPAAITTDLTVATSTTSSDDSDEAPRTITTTVSVHTQGGELVKRPRPSTSSSGYSDEQEDKRVKLTRPALPGPIEHTEPPRSPTPPSQVVYRAEIPTIPTSPPLPRRSPTPPPTEAPPLHQEAPAPVVAPHSASRTNNVHEDAECDPTPSCSHSAQLDSTSYAGLASPAQLDVPMRSVSPQPGPSYAAAAAAPASPCRAPQPPSAPAP